MKTKFSVFFSALSALSAVNLSRAAPPVTIENIRVGFGEAGQGRFKVGAWTPAAVDLKAGSESFRGVLELTVPDEDGTSTTTRRVVGLPPYGFATFQAFARPGTRNPEVVARVLDERGRLAADPKSSNAIDALDASQTMVLIAGNPRGVEDVAALTKFNAGNPASGGSPGSELVVARLRDFPSRWYGYDAAAAVVLDTNDPRMMEALRQGGLPLERWVRNGGHLVVAVGSNWQEVLGNTLLAGMLPAKPTGQVRRTDLGALETLAGGSSHPIGAPMMVTRLDVREEAGAMRLDAGASTPLVVRGPYGFGRVTLIGLDVDQKPFADWQDKPRFWDEILDITGRAADPSASVPGAGGALYQGGPRDLAGELHATLERFPGVKLVPFGWVAFFVFLYILLIGPGDYLFLRRVVKRMELTWITFPLIVAVVSALAYVGAYAVKGTELKVNKVDVVDIDQVRGQLRGATWLTLFSPQNRDYGLELLPLPPGRDPSAPVSERGLPNSEVLLSWFAPPEPRFGGGGRLSLSGSGYDYRPLGEAERLEGVRVPIWSTKSFTGRWSAPAARVLDDELRTVGADQVSGTVTNRLGRTLANARLVYRKRIYSLGTIGPGQTARVEATRNEGLSGYLGEIAQKFQQPGRYVYPHDEAPVSGAPRADVVRAILFHDAMGARAQAIPSIPLRDLDLTGQLELRRPMLVAELDGPAVAVRLGNAPSDPKIDQTTLIRVVLPAPKEQAVGSRK